MKHFLIGLVGIFIFGLLLWGSERTAIAYEDGVASLSGAFGTYCNICHNGGSGSVPQVAVTGAATVAPSATASYMLAITSTSPALQTVAGWDIMVAATYTDTLHAGVISGFDSGIAHLFNNELTHNAPLANDANGVATVNFDWTAPSTPGTYTIYFAGNSANNNGMNGAGDHAAAGSFEVVVSAPTQVGFLAGSAETAPLHLWLLLAILLLLTFKKVRRRA
ncbi:MAG TPA: hypothetical protein ENJ56_04640 [Anaerolineae bacterium]|nr:hypothetical protein [Anaerolineae bacterium]